ncbi:hypothetical protein LCGC14_2475070 [marine sediment metagenome]|uniref:Virulence-associated protein E-like domain-containing protein n=1 Tax=marine sediment metagenome TaxID=412755 RepID=A0A0F9B953_9ZZZZ
MSSPPEGPEGPPSPDIEAYENVVHLELVKDDFGDLAKDKKGSQSDVWAALDKVESKKGAVTPKPHVSNIRKILDGDTRWKGKLWWNEFEHCPYMKTTPVTDTREMEVSFWLSDVYKMHTDDKKISKVIDALAERDKRHPVRHYLKSLEWDGEERLGRMLIDRFRARDDSKDEGGGLNGAISTCWMISAVARIMKPGSKVDNALILVGLQGTKKSSAFEALAVNREWFNDSMLPIGHKDAYENLQGTWIYEIAELAGVNRRDQDTVKAFLTGKVDRFRPAYGRRTVKRERHCVFVGTTNQNTFLTDYTGNRRYWPVPVGGKADVAGIIEDRDQLWAEALHRYMADEQWYLTDEQEMLLVERCRQHEHEDPWEVHIIEWLIGRGEFTIAELLEGALGVKDKDKQTRAAAMHAANVLQRIGYTKRRILANGAQAVHWSKIDD